MKLAALAAVAWAAVGDCSLIAHLHPAAAPQLQQQQQRQRQHRLALTIGGRAGGGGGGDSAAAAANADGGARGLLPGPSPRDAGEHRATNESALPFFGDTACPCIGFDNIPEGEVIVTFEDGHDVAYPADLGSRCEAWDDGFHPTGCQEGQDPGLGHSWCAKQWCYVDPCQCGIDVLPQLSEYVPKVRYRGKPIFFSYATCGDTDRFTEKVPEVGHDRCRCIGFDNMPGTTEVLLGDGRKVNYPAEIGGSCRAWDKDRHPDCRGDNPPAWCQGNWCYVDPCSCDLPGPVVPKISAYLPNSTFTGKSLYFSYETCNSPDLWTDDFHPGACVNQETKMECDELERCTWTGERCLGTELVDHPLCQGVAEHMIHKLEEKLERKFEKDGAAQASPLAALAVAAAAATAAALASSATGR